MGWYVEEIECRDFPLKYLPCKANFSSWRWYSEMQHRWWLIRLLEVKTSDDLSKIVEWTKNLRLDAEANVVLLVQSSEFLFECPLHTTLCKSNKYCLIQNEGTFVLQFHNPRCQCWTLLKPTKHFEGRNYHYVYLFGI